MQPVCFLILALVSALCRDAKLARTVLEMSQQPGLNTARAVQQLQTLNDSTQIIILCLRWTDNISGSQGHANVLSPTALALAA